MAGRAGDPAARSTITVKGEVLERADPRWQVFAMRLALGSSITAAAQRAGVGRTTAHEWLKDPRVTQLIDSYRHEARNRARGELSGLVRSAVRTYKRILQDASAKGAPTQLSAAKDILLWAGIDQTEVDTNQERRVLTYVPRPDRQTITDNAEDTIEVIEAQTQQTGIPVQQTADGLPPDFPRESQSVQLRGELHQANEVPQEWVEAMMRADEMQRRRERKGL
jgi:hypothetical protein